MGDPKMLKESESQLPVFIGMIPVEDGKLDSLQTLYLGGATGALQS